jgi:trehalose 6-phosphate synthase/phosphatase
LPFKLEKKGGRIELKETDGGLVTAIKSLVERTGPLAGKVKWIGCANFREKDWEASKDLFAHHKINIHPVFLSKTLERGFYHGFSNSVIWPLFHYFPSFVEFDQKNYKCYEKVNELFALAISEIANKDDVIWAHDYHFMLLPGYLRSMDVNNKLGFFLHIPFPSYELFRQLPEEWRLNILKNLLAADVVGFQTADYAGHFTESLKKHSETLCLSEITLNNLLAKVREYPISVDFNRFNAAYNNKKIALARSSLLATYNSRKVIFSVDRLDYTKGVMYRLEAFEELLAENPHYLGKICFILNVVPSRDEISKYKERKKMIEENIGRINGKFGNVKWQPIIYQYRHLIFNQLLSFYTSCHVALVTPLRDGMNLVAKEFVASRKDEQGVLILSDMAGAACTLKGAIAVTPTDVSKMKECIIQALEMPQAEQATRMQSMRHEVRNNNVSKWAANYLRDLLMDKTKINQDAKVLAV